MIPRKTPLARGGRIKPRNAKRHSANWLRAYGSAERVQWVKSLPCLVCGATPSENAHVYTGGMGRKADAAKIVPLCLIHHAEQHAYGNRTIEDDYWLDLRAEAARIEAMWRMVAA